MIVTRWRESNHREIRKPRIQNPAEKRTETRGRRTRDNVSKENPDFSEPIFVEIIVGQTFVRFLRCWLQACMATSVKGTIMVKINQMSSIFT